jgi:sporulation protein YabP
MALDQNRYDRKDSQPSHDIKMHNRNKMEITGVVNVESFDNEEFLLETECGFLAIRGQNLHMKNLNVEDGLVSIEGLVMDMAYVDHTAGGDKAKGFFSKLFK